MNVIVKFSFMEEWKKYKMSDFIDFNPTISLKKGTVARKITMDKLIPHSRDIYEWEYEPYSGGSKFQNGDTIMARITPCLENGKHAFISLLNDGETAYGSTEYIVMRGIPGISDNRFVYYLSHFPDFKNAAVKSMVGSSGRQRAQVDVLKNLEFYLPGLKEQRKIADTLSALDDKIALNNRINHNLEEQIQERFDSMIISDNGLGYCQIADYVDVNPKRSLRKNEPAKCVDMSYLSTTGPFPSGWETKGYNGGMKFFNGDTIMARITPCLENGKVAYVNFLDDGEIAFGSTEFIVLHAKDGVAPVFTYFLARNKDFVDYATKNMNGSSGRQRVSGDTIGKYIIPVIDSDSLNEFSGFATPAMEVIRNNSFESRSLAATRDALLPLLLSGELSISQMNC